MQSRYGGAWTTCTRSAHRAAALMTTGHGHFIEALEIARLLLRAPETSDRNAARADRACRQ
eukprot:1243576-Rhodomonas_salina.1